MKFNYAKKHETVDKYPVLFLIEDAHKIKSALRVLKVKTFDELSRVNSFELLNLGVPVKTLELFKERVSQHGFRIK